MRRLEGGMRERPDANDSQFQAGSASRLRALVIFVVNVGSGALSRMMDFFLCPGARRRTQRREVARR
jgi:hypothetical protein